MHYDSGDEDYDWLNCSWETVVFPNSMFELNAIFIKTLYVYNERFSFP